MGKKTTTTVVDEYFENGELYSRTTTTTVEEDDQTDSYSILPRAAGGIVRGIDFPPYHRSPAQQYG